MSYSGGETRTEKKSLEIGTVPPGGFPCLPRKMMCREKPKGETASRALRPQKNAKRDLLERIVMTSGTQ